MVMAHAGVSASHLAETCGEYSYGARSCGVCSYGAYSRATRHGLVVVMLCYGLYSHGLCSYGPCHGLAVVMLVALVPAMVRRLQHRTAYLFLHSSYTFVLTY